jgi:enoyl-CoA hydratase/carnithine racemase
VYNLPGTKYLVDLVGPAKAKDILFSGRLMDAQEALQIGLIDRLYSPQEIVAKTYEYANLVAKNAQIAVRGSKRIIREICFGETREHGEIEQMILSSFNSDDYKEGVTAFLEKRKPHFQYS